MKAFLVDDEPLALDFLERQLKKISDIVIIGKQTYFNIDKDINILNEVDVVFLDIEMPEMNGLELAEKFLEKKPSLIIIFVTAFSDYAVQAFELDTLDYIVKPVQLDRLQKTIQRIEKKIYKQIDGSLSMNYPLRINVCSELTFELTDGKIEVVPWRTAKTRELFLYLLLHAGKTVLKSELAELLWSEFVPEKAYSQLYTSVYHVRQALSKFSNNFSLKSTSDGYVLFTEDVFIDIVEWEAKIKLSSSLDIETVETSMELYTGAYLEKYGYLWAEVESFRLEQLWLTTAHKIANYHAERHSVEKAETWYSKICDLQPEDEHAHFSLMKLYASLDYGLLVHHQFKQLKNALKELDLAMSPHITKWYYRWMEVEKQLN